MDDLISKSKLIEDINKCCGMREEIRETDCFCGILKLIEKQPTVNNWISVDDRLPENDERYKGRKVIDVLVTTEKGLVTKVQRQCYRDSWSWGRIFSKVIAWMPLPSKYISEE